MNAPAPLLILASASPRRRELLSQIGVRHEVLAVDVDESQWPGESPEQLVCRLARDKAIAGRARGGGKRFALGSDTIVVLAGQIHGKPRDEADARRILRELSGNSHEVLTAVALATPDGRLTEALSRTQVRMRRIDGAEISHYWASGEPQGKAGAYAIQGRGAAFIEAIHGSYSGVMGLPLYETTRLLQAEGLYGVHAPS